jgi:hypothetical protein
MYGPQPIYPTQLMKWATLDKGLISKVQWNQAFLLVKNFNLIPRPLDKGPWPKQIKLWFNLQGIVLKGKPIGMDQKKTFMESSWFGKSKCKLRSNIVHFYFVFCFFSFFFTLVIQILWKWKTCHALSTLAPSLLTNSIVGMAGFMDLHKVVAGRSAFLAFRNAWNGIELKDEVENEGLKCQFSQVERDLDLQKIFKLIPISNKKAQGKKWLW